MAIYYKNTGYTHKVTPTAIYRNKKYIYLCVFISSLYFQTQKKDVYPVYYKQ